MAATSQKAGANTILQWNDSLRVNIHQIDEHHKQRVNYVNALYGAMMEGGNKQATGKILGDLINYTSKHFKDEEDLFDQYGYPETDQHKRMYKELVTKVLDFQKQFELGAAGLDISLMEFLKDCLVNHIMKTDKRYVAFLHGHGVS